MEITNIWNDVLDNLTKKISAVSYEVWIKNLEPFCLKDNTLILSTKLESSVKTINKMYLDLIKEAVKANSDFIDDVLVILERDKDNFSSLYKTEKKEVAPLEETLLFNKNYTFDTFVIGRSNQIAYYAAKSVAEAPGNQHNPLFVYGGVGLGKTHIIQAIGNYILSKNSKANILYITTEQFINEFLDSLQDKGDGESNRRFRLKYRNVDVLMIDDIQFISNKKACQEALFHTFNDLYQNNKQIIFTSDKHPREIKELEERLLSRFQCGLTVDISQPDLETRIAIIKNKAIAKKFVISPIVAEFLAEKIDKNIRELEGALSKVIFYCSLTGQQADNIDVVKDALKDDISESGNTLNIENIVNCVCSYFGVSKVDIIGKKKNKGIVEPRQISIYLINDMLTMPLAAIGDYFGGRDHTTIMYARDKITEAILLDSNLETKINDIKNMILKK